jgi:hypothetical protein
MTMRLPVRITLAAALLFALPLALVLSGAFRASPDEYRRAASDPELLHHSVDAVTGAMLEAVTSPPVAARTYAYSGVAAYEALRQGSAAYRSLAGQVNGLRPVPAPEPGKEYLLPIAGVNAYLTVAEKLVFAPEKVAAHRDSLVRSLRDAGVPDELLDRSLAYGAAVGKHVLAWAATDGIGEARAAARIQVRPEPGRWVPTPPAYMDAVEPNWGTLRPFVLTSSSEIPIAPPTPFDTAAGSGFQRLAREIRDTGVGLTAEQRAIAGFWDCNPFAVQSEGHYMSALKKISPGGHWMGITAIALRHTHADILRSAEAYARVSMALSDGFVSAWREKYRSVRVRPVTVIQEEIDPSWQPLLQTPPFPEYPSAHSVISAAAAEVLSDLFGESYAFTDSTELAFGLPPRSFASFEDAAHEAAMSRMYGGIHLRDAAENGLRQGAGIGRTVVARIQTSGASTMRLVPAPGRLSRAETTEPRDHAH